MKPKFSPSKGAIVLAALGTLFFFCLAFTVLATKQNTPRQPDGWIQDIATIRRWQVSPDGRTLWICSGPSTLQQGRISVYDLNSERLVNRENGTFSDFLLLPDKQNFIDVQAQDFIPDRRYPGFSNSKWLVRRRSIATRETQQEFIVSGSLASRISPSGKHFITNDKRENSFDTDALIFDLFTRKKVKEISAPYLDLGSFSRDGDFFRYQNRRTTDVYSTDNWQLWHSFSQLYEVGFSVTGQKSAIGLADTKTLGIWSPQDGLKKIPISGIQKMDWVRQTKTGSLLLSGENSRFVFHLDAKNKTIGIWMPVKVIQLRSSDTKTVLASLSSSSFMQIVIGKTRTAIWNPDFHAWYIWENSTGRTLAVLDTGLDPLGEDIPAIEPFDSGPKGLFSPDESQFFSTRSDSLISHWKL